MTSLENILAGTTDNWYRQGKGVKGKEKKDKYCPCPTLPAGRQATHPRATSGTPWYFEKYLHILLITTISLL